MRRGSSLIEFGTRSYPWRCRTTIRRMIREAASVAAVVTLVVVPISAVPAAAAEPPPGTIPGIDVSRHQGTIDWAQVEASGQRFVIAKASEGLFTVDPTYATNRAGAMAAGLVFGAYHFARPDLHPDDPTGEADHFVDTAQLGPGNIVPVLDLDWYQSSDFTPVTIPSPDTAAPVATLATPTGVAGPLTVSFSEIVHDVT